MAEVIKQFGGFIFARKAFWAAAIMAVICFVIGLLSPPMGEVPEWVLPLIGWIFAFAALGSALGAIEAGLSASFKKGDVEVTIGNEHGDHAHTY